MHPFRATGSGGGFDGVPGALILELLRTQTSERRVLPVLVGVHLD